MVPEVTNSAASIWNSSAATFCNSAGIGQILQVKDGFGVAFRYLHSDLGHMSLT